MLKDRVVLVTGASRRIGRAIALRCAQEGAKLIITARDRADLETLNEEIRGYNITCESVPGGSARPSSDRSVARASASVCCLPTRVYDLCRPNDNPLGLVALLVWQWREGVLIWAALLTMLGFLLNYHVYGIAVFFLLSLIVVLAAASSGIATLMRAIDWLARRIGRLPNRRAPYATRLGAALLMLGVAVQVGRRYSKAGR